MVFNLFRAAKVRDAALHDKAPPSATRPSQVKGRTYVNAALAAQAASATVYSVPSGKTLYVKSILMTYRNISTIASGNLHVRDGTALRFSVGTELGAATDPNRAHVATMVFDEPLRFTEDVNVHVAGGDMRYHIALVGYHE